MNREKWVEWCDDCGKDTVHYYYGGFPGDRYQPEEPKGLECSECGSWTDLPEGGYDEIYGEY